MKKIVKILAFLSALIPSVTFAQTANNLAPKAYKEQLSKEKGAVQLIDVRTPKEFNAGHLKEAVNIDFFDKDFKTQIGKLDKEKAVYVYCASGKRSAKTVTMLKNLGFQSIYDLNGGYSKWITENNGSID